ncbi:hypothetical protein H2248_012598 [Termitomyces sp. 'cryptogamus']|nr:hypothetical protein H2248_012598 [Termitomyces sp. 'cryptogamus']
MQLGLGQHPCTEREDLGDMPRRSKEIMRSETIVVVYNGVKYSMVRCPEVNVLQVFQYAHSAQFFWHTHTSSYSGSFFVGTSPRLHGFTNPHCRTISASNLLLNAISRSWRISTSPWPSHSLDLALP